jgi:hypothetical protein
VRRFIVKNEVARGPADIQDEVTPSGGDPTMIEAALLVSALLAVLWAVIVSVQTVHRA